MTRRSMLVSAATALALAACGSPDDADRNEAETASPQEAAPETPAAPPSTEVEQAGPPSGIEPPAVAAPEPANDDAPAAEEAALHAADGLSAERLVVATGVDDHEPVGASQRFDGSADRLYAFVELRNESEVEREVVVTFEGPGGRETGAVTLTVPANVPRWRTWAFTRHATVPGSWAAVARTPDGELLARRGFEIAGAAPGS